MGDQHVPLTINEDGLVTSIGNQSNSDDKFETCVLCGKKTNVLKTTHIDFRHGYVEGSGQCCSDCYNGTNNNYVDTVMKNRTTLITISAEDILNTPNDADLGAKVRRMYWETQQGKTTKSWICSLCGEDTSNVDYDYLIGFDHLSCRLSKEMP